MSYTQVAVVVHQGMGEKLLKSTAHVYQLCFTHQKKVSFAFCVLGSSDVLRILKITRSVGECNLRTFKTSRVAINREKHEQVHTIF